MKAEQLLEDAYELRTLIDLYKDGNNVRATRTHLLKKIIDMRRSVREYQKQLQ